MPKVIYQAAQIEDADWEVRAAIATIAHLDSEPTPEAIARFTGMSKKAIAPSLRRLEEVGLIFRSSARRSVRSDSGSKPTSAVASTTTKCPRSARNPHPAQRSK
ncbi:winged helix DNA-binding protein [Thermoleptolyngbya sp. M55_K2018_002]|uniref:winged helix DNA-binding protein n=1 Tax=Thermoleptolyngbya sp. M55_K2018_002 TaxID=2747808 RepID=UPI0019FF5636|nr:winged helix DNA-binding protein [Thermoleptolyngbya sp. M55_K2018_002]HIK40414.1 hypothetical protein [Thermoleptolyngbya sp. M55_K2018_002]